MTPAIKPLAKLSTVVSWHLALALVLAPLAYAVAERRGLVALLAAGGLVLVFGGVGQLATRIITHGSGSLAFTTIVGAASRLLLFLGLVAYGSGAAPSSLSANGLPTNEVKLFACLVIPFYLLHLTIDVWAAKFHLAPAAVTRPTHCC